jgi:hypothetical protein
MDDNQLTQTPPRDDYAITVLYRPEPVRPPEPEPAKEWEWYAPSFFSRLAENRPLVIFLIIAFLVLVVGPSLFYVFNPPRPRPPLPVRGRGFPTLQERESPSRHLAGSGWSRHDRTT